VSSGETFFCDCLEILVADDTDPNPLDVDPPCYSQLRLTIASELDKNVSIDLVSISLRNLKAFSQVSHQPVSFLFSGAPTSVVAEVA